MENNTVENNEKIVDHFENGDVIRLSEYDILNERMGQIEIEMLQAVNDNDEEKIMALENEKNENIARLEELEKEHKIEA